MSNAAGCSRVTQEVIAGRTAPIHHLGGLSFRADPF